MREREVRKSNSEGDERGSNNDDWQKEVKRKRKNNFGCDDARKVREKYSRMIREIK